MTPKKSTPIHPSVSQAEPSPHHGSLENSTTLLRALSRLPTTSRPTLPPPARGPQVPLTPTLLLLLPLRFLLASSKSPGCIPLARAYRFRISVRLTTPERRPERLALLTDGLDERDMDVVLMAGLELRDEERGRGGAGGGKWCAEILGVECAEGVDGIELDGDGDSTIHMLGEDGS